MGLWFRKLDPVKLVVLIFVSALLIGVLGGFRYMKTPVKGDAQFHKNLGLEVTSGDWIDSETFGNVRTPGYPLLLGCIYSILGKNDIYIKIVQVIIFAATAAILFLLGDAAFCKPVGFIGAIWFITFYDYVSFSYMLMREIVVAFFITVVVALFVAYFIKKRIICLTFGSFCLGCLIMIDPRYLFLVLVLVTFFTIFAKGLWSKVRGSFLVLIFTCMFVLLWSLRQSFVYNRFVLLTPVDDAQIGMLLKPEKQPLSIGSDKEYLTGNMVRDDYLRDLNETGLSPSKKQALAEQLTQEYIQEMRTKIPKRVLPIMWHRFIDYWRFARFHIGVSTANDVRFRFPWPLPKNLSNIIHIGLLLPFFLVGVIQIVRTIKAPQLLVLLVITYHMVFHLVVHYIYRYRLHILPLVFLVGWFGVLSTYNGLRSHKVKIKYAHK